MNVLLPLAVVAIAGTATIASADTENAFSLARIQPTTSFVDFGFVNSDADGLVEIYNYDGQVIGALLGSQAVTLGTNSGLRVQLNPPPFQSAMAILTIDGVAVANQEVDFRRQVQ